MKPWIIRLSLYTFVVTGMSISCMLFFYALHQIKHHTCFIDPYCSQSTVTELNHYVHDHRTKFFSSTLIEQLHIQFPFIEKSSLRLTPNGTLQCRIQCAHPRLLLNEEHILLSNNVIACSTLFEPSMIQSLPRIFLANHHSLMNLPLSTKNILNDIPTHLFTDYTIHFVDSSEIYLIDKHKPRTKIVADKQSIKTINLDHCKLIYDQEKKLLEKKSHATLVMDVRFSHQIIVRFQAVQGGAL